MVAKTQADVTTNSTCPYCGVGCGLQVINQSKKPVILGDTEHPANFGRLCVKGAALSQTLNEYGRLIAPQIDGMTTDWPSAISTTAKRLTEIIRKYGPQSVAMYLSGQLLTEDYYVANKLLKGFIGSAHLDTNSRLCMASTVAGHKRAFGEDVVPGCYEDLEVADLVILVGSNLAYAHPVLFQRLMASKAANPNKKIVVVDPRRTATADNADLHLALKPGSDVALFSGLLQYAASHGVLDKTFTEQYCNGLEAALIASQCWEDLSELAVYCDIAFADLLELCNWFVENPRTVTVFSQGVNQASDGTDKVNAIINVHLATGRIGKAGACPLSVTGQPNAMGGREVGALANQLAGHLRFPAELVGIDEYPDAEWLALQQFWRAPALVKQGGYTAVELFEAVARGEIKAIWIIATNPVVSLPQADLVKNALSKCELVIVSEIYQDTDTLAHADIVFPALGFAEKDGTVTNSERRISRQRAFLPPIGQARADWRIVCDVAKAMGFAEGFNFERPAQIFREHAALTGLVNGGQRALDLTDLQMLTDAAYDDFKPKSWPMIGGSETTRLFADGRFYTSDRKARLLPLTGRKVNNAAAEPQFILNSGRLRDQWHTMTRTGRVPALMQHQTEPFIAIHPIDAAKYKVKDGNLLAISNQLGMYLGRAQVTDTQRVGELFVPMHWSSQFASTSRCDVLFGDTRDPISQQPAFKQGKVSLKKLSVTLEIVIFTRHRTLLKLLQPWAQYVAMLPYDTMQEYRLALTRPMHQIADVVASLSQLLQHINSGNPLQTELQKIEVDAPDTWRQALFEGEALQALMFAGPTLPEFDRVWLDKCFAEPTPLAFRRQLLRGKPFVAADCSVLVCSCFQVRQQSIQQAIDDGVNCTKALGEKLRCGTGCGSCLPEIRQMLKATFHSSGQQAL